MDNRRDRRGRSDGTKVTQDVLRVEADTLFPLQGALGYRSDADFVRRRTHASGRGTQATSCISRGSRQRLRRAVGRGWTLAGRFARAGGIDRIMPFVSLFVGQRLHVAVLSDEAQGAKGKVERIRKSDILRAGHFYTVADFIDAAEGRH